jgi:hypothetical protein
MLIKVRNNHKNVNIEYKTYDHLTVSMGVPFFRIGRSERSPNFSTVATAFSEPNLQNKKDDI